MFSAVLPQKDALKMPLGHDDDKLFLNLIFCLDLMVKSMKQHPFTSSIQTWFLLFQSKAWLSSET